MLPPPPRAASSHPPHLPSLGIKPFPLLCYQTVPLLEAPLKHQKATQSFILYCANTASQRVYREMWAIAQKALWPHADTLLCSALPRLAG